MFYSLTSPYVDFSGDLPGDSGLNPIISLAVFLQLFSILSILLFYSFMIGPFSYELYLSWLYYRAFEANGAKGI